MKKFKKILSSALVMIMVLSLFKISLLALDYSKVRVIVENSTYSVDSGAPWDGVLIDEWVRITDSSDAISVVAEALSSKGYSHTGANNGYITEINSLSEYDAIYSSGWVGTINDWFPNEALSTFTTASGKLIDGDEIRILYSLEWGADLGSSWDDNSTALASLAVDGGSLSPGFNGDTMDYSLTPDEGANEIKLTPAAENKNFQVRIYKNDYTPVSPAGFRSGTSMSVETGDVIYIGVGDENWPSMNEGAAGTVYTIKIGTNVVDNSAFITSALTDIGEWYPVFSKNQLSYSIMIEAGSVLPVLSFEASAGANVSLANGEISPDNNGKYSLTLTESAQSVTVKMGDESTTYTFKVIRKINSDPDEKYDDIYTSTGKYLLNGPVPGAASVSGEWSVLGLARAGIISERFAKGYYINLHNTVKNTGEKLSKSKSAENSRAIIALTALGYDPTNIDSVNLIAPLADFDYVKRQGINGSIFALIALDTKDYSIPSSSAQNPTTRQKLIDEILSYQLDTGAWGLDGKTADIDITAMAIQALARYYATDENVKSAIDSALEYISTAQKSDGSLSATSEGNSQVIIALTALNIDPTTDTRFIKNEKSVIDALAKFYVNGGGFRHILDGDVDAMASEQGYNALVAYKRQAENKTSLYDMSDVINRESPEIPVTESEKNTTSPNASGSNIDTEHKIPNTGEYRDLVPYLLIFAASLVSVIFIFKKKKVAE